MRDYVLDDPGHISTFKIVAALDDEVAIEASNLAIDGHDIELWYLDR